MTTSDWQLLCMIDLHHGYYADGNWQDAVIEPTSSTAKDFHRYGCRLRKTASGAEIWYQTTNGDAPLKALPATTSFGFVLQSSNHYFHTITKMSGAAQGEVLVFREGAVQVTNASGGDLQQFDPPVGRPVPVRSSTFRQSFAHPRAAQTISVVSATDGEIYWQEPHGGGKFTDLSLMLSGVPEGLCTLRFDTDDVMEFVLLNQPQAIGYIALTPAATSVPPTQRMVSDRSTIRQQNFALKLEPRSSLWRYIVTGLPSPTAQVIPKGAQTTFSTPAQTQVSGRTALEFTSRAPIPLLQSQRHTSFTLHYADHNGVLIRLPLPIASPQSTSLERTPQGDQLVSTMYVNL